MKTRIILIAGAALALTACSRSNLPQVPRGQAPHEYKNVVVHDPSILKAADGYYYVNGSDMCGARSADLIDWEQISKDIRYDEPSWFADTRNELASVMAWGHTRTFWASCLIQLQSGPYKGKYMFDYCVCQGGCPQAAIGYAIADKPEGPYKDMGVLLYSFGSVRTDDIYDAETVQKLRAGERGDVNTFVEIETPSGEKVRYNSNFMPNAIDPCTFYDADGQLWMVYGSFSGGIFMHRLNEDGTIHREPGDDYYGHYVMGNYHSTIEGVFIMYSPETKYYYMFASFGMLQPSGGYNVRVFRSRTPDGDYVDAAGNHAYDCKGIPGQTLAKQYPYIEKYGLKMMGNFEFEPYGENEHPSEAYLSPGHNSALYDADRDQYFYFHHTRFKDQGDKYQVRVREMFMNEDGWPVVAAHRYAGDIPGVRFSKKDLVGEWKYINHGTKITPEIVESSLITLNGDGTVTGAVNGTWAMEKKQDHYYATFNLDGKVFKGVFHYQYDPDNNVNRLTFSACGASNETIWGSKAKVR